jgi:hypothetical protein
METKDKISSNEMDGINLHDVYRKFIENCNILYKREKMGGNIGVHSVKQDPPSEIEPKS